MQTAGQVGVELLHECFRATCGRRRACTNDGRSVIEKEIRLAGVEDRCATIWDSLTNAQVGRETWWCEGVRCDDGRVDNRMLTNSSCKHQVNIFTPSSTPSRPPCYTPNACRCATDQPCDAVQPRTPPPHLTKHRQELIRHRHLLCHQQAPSSAAPSMSSGRALAARQGAGPPAVARSGQRSASAAKQQQQAAAAPAAGEIKVIQNPLHFGNNVGVVYFLCVYTAAGWATARAFCCVACRVTVLLSQ